MKSALKFFRPALYTVAIALVLLMPPAVHSGPLPASGYQKCLHNVDVNIIKNGQWTACAEEDLAQLDAKLNATYKALKNKSAPEQREFLVKAQRSWLKYREEWCRYEEVSELAPGGAANYVFCMKDMTEKQLESLEGMSQ